MSAPATLAFFGLVSILGSCLGFALAVRGAEEANLLLTAFGVLTAGVFLICVVALVLEWWSAADDLGLFSVTILGGARRRLLRGPVGRWRSPRSRSP